jgi:hypothetical protein
LLQHPGYDVGISETGRHGVVGEEEKVMPDITPSVLANAIMGKLYDVLTNGDATVPKSADNFYSWATPGIPVDADDFQFLTQGFTGVVKPAAARTLLQAVGAGSASQSNGSGDNPSPQPALTDAQLAQLRAQDTAGLYQQAEFFARLVDFVPDVSRLNNEHFATLSVMNNEGTLSEIYERVLTFSQVMATQLPADVQQKIARFRSLLVATTEKTDLITGDKVLVTGPSPLVQAYTDKMAAYENAALEYNSHRIDALAADDPRAVSYWAINATTLRNKVKAAMADWITNGYKEQYEQIAAYIAQVEGRDLTLLKQAYLDDLQKAKLTGLASGSDFYYTALTPANFATSAGWTPFYFNSGNFASYANATFKASGWETRAGGGFLGIFGGGGGGGSSSRNAYIGLFNSDHCSMRFEIAQIPLLTPWLKKSYLTSKTWRFDPGNPDVKNDLLSDGGSPPRGLLTAYPTSLIFVRNLSLDFGNNSSFLHYLDEQRSSHAGGGSVAIGPFFLGGSASHWSQEHNMQRDWGYSYTNQGVKVPGMQIVGFKCHILPKSPNPSPDITAWV